jgi:uncharacterized protein (TIGR03067 family)
MIRTTAVWSACLLLILVAAPCAGAEPEGDEVRKQAVQEELARFAGIWEILTEGQTGPAQFAVFRKDGTYSTYDKDGKELWLGTFEIDPTAKPKVWDHRSRESKQAGRDRLGIYELDGDELKVCVNEGHWKNGKWEGKPRPTEFKDSEAYAVIEFRRIRK